MIKKDGESERNGGNMAYFKDLKLITKKDIGLAIRTLRKKAGIETQEELGKKLNPKPVTKGTINKIETGRGNYTIDTLFRIAEALSCSVSDFFGVKEKPPEISMIEKLVEELMEEKIKEHRNQKK